MKNFLFVIVMAAVVVAAIELYAVQRDQLADCRADREALLQQLFESSSRCDSLSAETDRLTLSVAELVRVRRELTERLKSQGLSLRRIESLSQSVAVTLVEPSVAVVPLADSLRRFEWNDPWVRVSGVVAPDSISCRIESVDTLLQTLYRVPYRWWFFRWGTKAVRQRVGSSNPHTRIVYSEYIELR